MLNLELISTIIGVCAGLGLMAGGCGYAYSTWKAGKNRYKDDLINDLKETIVSRDLTIVKLNEEKTTLITSHQQQLTVLHKELAELKGRVDEQTKKIEDYKAILQNRDPQLLEILNEIKNGIGTMNKHQENQEAKADIVAEKLAKSI